MGEIFGIKHSTIANIRKKATKEPKVIGREKISSDDQESTIINLIYENAKKGALVTKEEFLEMGKELSGKELTKGWISSFLARNLYKIGFTKAIPQVKLRLKVPSEHLNHHIQVIQKYVTGKAIELVFNLDEMDSSD